MISTNALRTRAALKTGAASLVLAVGLVSTPSFAQTPNEAAPGATIAPVSQNGSPGQVALTAAESGEAIIVTGSRIVRPDLDTASPIQVLSQQEFQLSGAANVEDVLYDLPQFYGSLTAGSNNPGDGSVTADLRGLGAARTLVLVNGRRWVSYDVTQIVDLNTIPASLVKRTDVLTGGRGAVYGSDAIAGVVNFVLNDEFEGAQVDVGYRLTAQGDGPQFNASLTLGSNFADGRGNVTVYGNYTQRDPIFQYQRELSRYVWNDNDDGTISRGGSGSIPELRFSSARFPSGQIPGFNPGTSYRFNQTGGLASYSLAANGYNFAPQNYLQVPQERWFIGGFANYEVNEHAEVYTELAFINNNVTTQLAETPATGNYRIPVNSPYFDAATQAKFTAADQLQTGSITANGLLDAPKDGYITISAGRRLIESGPRISDNERNAFRTLIGLRGEISGPWRYDMYYSFAQTHNTETQEGNVSISRFQNSLNTTGTTLGTVQCANGGADGCVPANIYGAGKVSPAAAAYFTVPTSNITTVNEQVFNAAITNGELYDFGMGAAPVGLALGFEWRSEYGDYRPDFILSTGDVVGFNAGQQTKGGWSVKDVFGELNVPIVADRPGFYNLELNGAVRYSSYDNNVGNRWTWSAGGQWEVIKGATIRGQYQSALRAPTVSALYLGNSVGFPSLQDYCQQAVAATNASLRQSCINNGVPAGLVGTAFGSGNSQVQATFGGNPNLEAETSKTWTIGGVLVPSQLPALSFTVDYFNITVNNAILATGPQASQVRDACFGTAQNGYVPYDTSFCALIPRDPSSFDIDGLILTNVNAGFYATSGIDFALNYGLNAGFGAFGASDSRFTMRATFTYLLNYEFNDLAAIPDLLQDCTGQFGLTCGDPYAKVRGSVRVTWATGPMTAAVVWRYIGGTDNDGTAGFTNPYVEHLDAKNYVDLSASWNVSKNFSFLFGVDNIFNTKAQLIPDQYDQQGGTYPATYDVYGTRFFVGATATF